MSDVSHFQFPFAYFGGSATCNLARKIGRNQPWAYQQIPRARPIAVREPDQRHLTFMQNRVATMQHIPRAKRVHFIPGGNVQRVTHQIQNRIPDSAPQVRVKQMLEG